MGGRHSVGYVSNGLSNNQYSVKKEQKCRQTGGYVGVTVVGAGESTLPVAPLRPPRSRVANTWSIAASTHLRSFFPTSRLPFQQSAILSTGVYDYLRERRVHHISSCNELRLELHRIQTEVSEL